MSARKLDNCPHTSSRLLVFLVPCLLLRSMVAVHGFAADLRPPSQQATRQQFIGVDLGTSGARISIIQPNVDADTNSDAILSFDEVYAQAVAWDSNTLGSYDDPSAWMKAVTSLLHSATERMSLSSVQSICISGTSASCLLVEPAVTVLEGSSSTTNTTTSGLLVQPTRGTAPRMYNYNVENAAALAVINTFAPPRHTARSPTGALAKLLAWNAERPDSINRQRERLCHQADYVIRQFLTRNHDNETAQDIISIGSDWHNCLKLGYDVRRLEWPPWLSDCLESVGLSTAVLPHPVVSPGTPVGPVAPWVCQQFGLPEHCVLTGGTTDSNAAFFAAVGITADPGTAVTSLGSTLAIKLLSTAYVEDAEKGVYSHRFPSVFDDESSRGTGAARGETACWLVGGASNAGCLVLRTQGFTNEELDELSQNINPDTDTHLKYYPLTKKGERFPVADSNKEPILEPVPDSRGEFLHGILQGISDVERDGFLALSELGASPSTPHHVWTCGGGSRNNVWNRLRQRRLRAAFGSGVTVARADNVEASYGAAILAAASFVKSSREQRQL